MRKYIFLNYVVLFFTVFSSCEQTKNNNIPTTSDRYDFENPITTILPEELAEISGIAFYPKDSSVFAIVDEAAILFKVSLNKINEIKKWKFDRKRDFEDIIIHNSIFFVLVSNGDIETIQFNERDSIITTLSKFPDADKKTNEFESLYFDDSLKQIILLCKNCKSDGSKIATAWSYDINLKNYSPSIYTIDVSSLAKKLQKEKIKLRASATAINPISNDVYILSSINHIILVTDRQGNYKTLYYLNPVIYKKPEGLAFTAWGDMLVCNEWKENGSANILIIKNKQKGL